VVDSVLTAEGLGSDALRFVCRHRHLVRILHSLIRRLDSRKLRDFLRVPAIEKDAF